MSTIQALTCLLSFAFMMLYLWNRSRISDLEGEVKKMHVELVLIHDKLRQQQSEQPKESSDGIR
jgi:hypothetical protein